MKKQKLLAIWNILISEYFVLFSQRQKGGKWTNVSARLDSRDHIEMIQAIEDCKKNQ